jgi:hypothetical protein
MSASELKWKPVKKYASPAVRELFDICEQSDANSVGRIYCQAIESFVSCSLLDPTDASRQGIIQQRICGDIDRLASNLHYNVQSVLGLSIAEHKQIADVTCGIDDAIKVYVTSQQSSLLSQTR